MQKHWRLQVSGKMMGDVSHPSVESANAEAERLAKKENSPVYIYELIGGFRPAAPPIEWVPATNSGSKISA